jgi:hypothetical protein
MALACTENTIGHERCYAPIFAVVGHDEPERQFRKGPEYGLVVDLSTDQQQVHRDKVGFVQLTGRPIRVGVCAAAYRDSVFAVSLTPLCNDRCEGMRARSRDVWPEAPRA